MKVLWTAGSDCQQVVSKISAKGLQSRLRVRLRKQKEMFDKSEYGCLNLSGRLTAGWAVMTLREICGGMAW